MDARTTALVAAFKQAYGSMPERAVRAPGRVNLIGEHTDYNDGFCLPMAIERDVRIVLSLRHDRRVRALSLQQGAAVIEFGIGGEIPKARRGEERWADYVKGCAQILDSESPGLMGMDCAISGDVPLGSGLSSSAALEVATLQALSAANRRAFGSRLLAQLAQRAENQYVGNNCGILDPLSSACATSGSAMLMDCRSLHLTPAPLPAGVSVVIADTGKRRGLVDSAYNERRAQCEAGARALQVSHLRDVTLHGLWRAADEQRIDGLTLSRCEHVVAENGRALAAFSCLRANDAAAFGALMDQSHADLRDKFQVSCRELDDMVACARSSPGCFGSRMTGAGFGGCTVSLVREESAEAFIRELTVAYQKRHDLPVAVYLTGAAAGAGELEI